MCLKFPSFYDADSLKSVWFQSQTDVLKNYTLGQPGWLSGLAPPSAQGVILETWDRVPSQAPCMEPASPSAYVSAILSLSLMNK